MVINLKIILGIRINFQNKPSQNSFKTKFCLYTVANYFIQKNQLTIKALYDPPIYQPIENGLMMI